MHVKICGITTPEALLVSAAVRADSIGFVFAPSKRQLTAAHAKALKQTLRAAGYLTQIVGLFVNETPETIAAVTADVGLDVVQLHGDEPFQIVDALPVMPLWKAVRLRGAPDEAAWLGHTQTNITLLVDAYTPDAYGGTGVRADWEKARDLARQRDIVLAGGLTPQNVRSAIETVRPWGVDVSSGVERAGYKDNGYIAAFVDIAKQA